MCQFQYRPTRLSIPGNYWKSWKRMKYMLFTTIKKKFPFKSYVKKLFVGCAKGYICFIHKRDSKNAMLLCKYQNITKGRLTRN
jgi:hypothetical protein